MKNNRLQQIYIACTVALLAAAGLSTVILPQKTYSELENRYLTVYPIAEDWTADTIARGELQTHLTEAASDQFPFRDRFMKAATTAQYLLHPTEVNDVYVGRKQALFNKVTESELSEKNYENNLSYITSFKAREELRKTDVALMLIPTPGTVLEDQLPKKAVLYDIDAYYARGEQHCEADSVRFIQTQDALKRAQAHSVKPLYFTTDHHWTTYGAYEGAKIYLETTHHNGNQKIADLSEYQLTQASDDFYGTIYSKVAGLPMKKPDIIDIPEYLPPNVTVETNGAPADALDANGEKTKPQLDGIYDRSKLSGKNQYAVYFGGNYAKLTIKNADDRLQGRRMLIFKDSYANSMVPYLIPYYEQITMIDLRYYNEDIAELLAEEQPQSVLFCYEMSNFINDRNILKIIR